MLLALVLAATVTDPPPSLWGRLRSADAVVRVHVESVEGRVARVRVREQMKGELPAKVELPSEELTGCLLSQALFAGDDAVVLVRFTRPREVPAELKDMEERQAREHPYALDTVLGGETSKLIRSALERQASGARAPSEEWVLELLGTPGLRGQGLEVLARDLPMTPKLEAAVERGFASGAFDPYLLPRVLTVLAGDSSPSVTRMGYDALDRAVRGRWAVIANESMELLAAREGLEAPDGPTPLARYEALLKLRAARR